MTTTPYDAEIASEDTDPTARTIAIVMRKGYLRAKAEDAATIAVLLEAAKASVELRSNHGELCEAQYGGMQSWETSPPVCSCGLDDLIAAIAQAAKEVA